MKYFSFPATDLSRRRFVRGLALSGAAAGLGWLRPSSAWALNHGDATELRGAEFTLEIGESPVNVTGVTRVATTVNGRMPGPTLRCRQGDTLTIHVRNRLRVPTSIHWHGIVLPSGMDGVPGLSFDGIAPGETFVYRFALKQSGTYWYHSHSRFQEQTGLFGALVIEPSEPPRYPADRDYVVMLNDWTDENPEHIFAKLKKQSDYYNHGLPTVPELFRDVRTQGVQKALAERRMWNDMRMDRTDFADVSGATYTYLMNGAAPAGNWTGLFHPGEKIRLRFINGSSMSIFDVRIPGLKMTVVAADGQDVAPVSVDEFRIATAETYDVIVEPQDDRAYTLFAQSIDRSGYAHGTLAPRPGMQAEVPDVDRIVPLGMADMMGAVAMQGLGHHDGMAGMRDMPMGNPPAVHHARTEYGAGVDMRVDRPRTNIDDPGIGLRNNGRRVLTYADLHTVGGSIDTRQPGREIELHLTGNMQRYMWSFDGVKFSDAKPIHFRKGERLRIVLVNDTMMNHPIHLHGMWSELENPDGKFQVRKHTINVQPAQRITYAVTADNPGSWAYHCHMLYHMEAGMFREAVVS